MNNLQTIKEAVIAAVPEVSNKSPKMKRDTKGRYVKTTPEGLRRCTICRVVFPMNSNFFYPLSIKSSPGHRGFSYKCIPCNNSYITSRSKEYYKRKREMFIRLTRDWAERNPEKVKASNKVKHAIKTGAIARKPCEVCGREKTHAHHDDYSKPLDVRWLCASCHRKHHNSLKKLAKG